MEQADYKAMYDKLLDESNELAALRSEMETDLNEVKVRLENIESALRAIRPLTGMSSGDDLKGLGITDAIRSVLENTRNRLTATEVRKALGNKGFDLSGYSSPMSSIWTVLKRLTSDAETRIVREEDEKKNVYYYYKQEYEITDDDIPF